MLTADLLRVMLTLSDSPDITLRSRGHTLILSWWGQDLWRTAYDNEPAGFCNDDQLDRWLRTFPDLEITC